ncbi:MAG: DNA internalization-related competence protein ComEC/Rec2 [Oscillospiraceae bacterium]|nr:DNA internalization-related competence protein ComEC/Rec2 [Oscillospiraceae bacterium]
MRRLLWFTLGFVLACLLAVYLLPEEWLSWFALGGALLLAGLTVVRLRLRQHSRRKTASFPLRIGLALSLGLAVGLLWCRGYGLLVLDPARTGAGAYEALEAELCDYPVDAENSRRTDVWVELDGRRVKARLYLYGALPELEPGDRIRGSFKLRRADRNADGELLLSLQAKGILLTGSGTAEAVAYGGAPFRYFPVRWSRAVRERLGQLIPADAAALPQAMLTGNRDGLSPADKNALSAAGASHIVAVSGLHVSMLMAVLILLVGRGKLSALLGIPLLALYALMTGASPSVLRAAVMLSLLLLAPLVGKENDPPTSLAFAGLVLLLQNPWAIANVSFQLSFAAVAGLLLASRPLLDYLLKLRRVRKLLRWAGPKAWPRLPRLWLLRLLRGGVRFVCGSFSASLGALLFSTPIAALSFGVIPCYGVLTNLLVLPLATLVLEGGLLVLALGLVSTTLGGWAGWLLAWPVRAILGICRLVSRLPGSLLYTDAYGIAFLAFVGLTLLLVLLLREKRLGWPLLSALAVLIGMAGLQSLDAASADFTLAALDVGQGQCVCMLTEDFAVMTDCGGTGGGRVGETAAAWLRRHGAERLDALILTHYDTDHVSGVETLLALVPVETLWLPEVDFDPENRLAVENAARAAGAELRYVTEDETLACSGGCVRLFAPVSDRNDNAACVSVLYSAAEYDMLVTGDLDTGAELALLDREELPRVECYVAGHHGSARSSSEALLETVRPETVLISVDSNGYGLPSAEALARFDAVGAAIYRTDECGDLVLSVCEP